MDEPLLTVTIEETSRSSAAATPQLRGISPAGAIYRDLNTVDSLLPTIIATPKSSLKNLLANLSEKRRLTRRSHSSPSIFTDERDLARAASSIGKPKKKKQTEKIVRIASIGLLIYIVIGLAVFMFTNSMFTGEKTLVPIDALYFTVVTLCTIGYGDIVPNTTFTKLFTCVFILVGFGFIDILLNGLVTHVLDRQEAVLLGAMDENKFNNMVNTYLVDKKKGRMRIRTKVGLALGVVVFCLALGTIIVHYVENLSWVDSFYLSVTSVTTVGYGDYAFKTVTGRCFAVIWLLLSTLAVARAFLYLTEFRIDKRNRKAAKWVLQRKIDVGDLVAADWDNDGSISKAEYVIYKLKEMGKITDKDVLPICMKFDSLENSHIGKITYASMQEGESQ